MQCAQRLLDPLVIRLQPGVLALQSVQLLLGLLGGFLNVANHVLPVEAAEHAGFEIRAHSFSPPQMQYISLSTNDTTNAAA